MQTYIVERTVTRTERFKVEAESSDEAIQTVENGVYEENLTPIKIVHSESSIDYCNTLEEWNKEIDSMKNYI